MKETSVEFGELLTTGIKAIAARQRKTIAAVQDEMGYDLGRRGGGSAIEYWRKGYVPDYQDVEKIAKLCLTKGGLDKSWLSDFLQAARHPAPHLIIQSLFGKNELVQRLKHNLPRRDYVEFVGRHENLEEIAGWLHPADRAWLLTIDGIGGIGKSALALEAAYRLLESRPPFIAAYPYEAVIWVSAKQEFLTLDGKIPSADFFQTLADVYTAIAHVLEREDIIRSQPQDQKWLVKQVLEKRPVLLIVDNLESVADKTVHAFLRNDLPDKSKAIITTRERINVAENMRVLALNRKEGLALINRESQAAHIVLAEDQQDKLFRRTGGIPLVITLSVARVAAGYPMDGIMANYGKVQEDLVSYCIQSSIDALPGQEARQTLLALSIFVADADAKALQTVAGFVVDPLSFKEAVAHLERLSLVNKEEEADSKRYSMLPTTRAFTHQILAAEPNLKQIMLERQIQFYLDMLAEIGYYYTPDNWRQLRTLDGERENIFGLMTYLYEQQAWQLVIQFLAYLYGYLSFCGYWSDYLKWMECAVTAADVLKTADKLDLETQKLLGWCLSEQCWIQCNLKQPGLAKDSGKEALAIFRATKERDGEARVLRHFGVIALECYNKIDDAKRYYHEALNIWHELGKEEEIVSIYNNLGSVALQEKNFSEAETLLLKTLELKEKLNDIPRLGNTLYYLGQLYFWQGNLEKARSFSQRTAENTKRCGNILYEAKAIFNLAQINAIENNKQTALDLAQKSLSSFHHLGMEEQCQDVTDFIDNILRDIK